MTEYSFFDVTLSDADAVLGNDRVSPETIGCTDLKVIRLERVLISCGIMFLQNVYHLYRLSETTVETPTSEIF